MRRRSSFFLPACVLLIAALASLTPAIGLVTLAVPDHELITARVSHLEPPHAYHACNPTKLLLGLVPPDMRVMHESVIGADAPMRATAQVSQLPARFSQIRAPPAA